MQQGDARRSRKTYRYREYDYSQVGSYVFTVVVEKRKCFLGTVRDQQFTPTEAGEIVQSCWLNLPERFPAIGLDAFGVMPNHIHGIVFLGANPDVEDDAAQSTIRTLALLSTNETVASPFMAQTSSGRRPIPPSRDPIRPALGEIVRSLKAASTTLIRKSLFPTFAWQPNYWDRIIRNDAELERYRTYIENNPARWEEDKESLKGDW